MTATKRQCAWCVYFNRFTNRTGDGKYRLGECRHSPPTMTISRDRAQLGKTKVPAQWPIVSDCDWCGGFSSVFPEGNCK